MQLANLAGASPHLQYLRALQHNADIRPVGAGLPIQRTIDTAVQALFQAGLVKVPTRAKDRTKFLQDHGVSAQDIVEIEQQLAERRAADKAANVVETVDMTDNANWPEAGGMDETDAAIVAGVEGWVEVNSTKMTCADRAHTPKGKVYQSGSRYYGADNTGHAGWGFKVWVTKKGNMLDYKGNIVWRGGAWVHDPRGT